MNVLSVLSHPRDGSFCHALSSRAVSTLEQLGHDVIHHDLYAEAFDPVLKADEAYTAGDSIEHALAKVGDEGVLEHRRDIAQADGLLVVHPNWWGKPPAMMSGWLDRVLVPGVAYRLQRADGVPDGLLGISKALILNTSDTPRDREDTDLGDPLSLIWGRCVLPFCGVAHSHRHVFGPVAGSDARQREQWLERTAELVRECFGR